MNMHNEIARGVATAHHLGYGAETVERIKNAKSVSEISRALHTARDEKYKRELELKRIIKKRRECVC